MVEVADVRKPLDLLIDLHRGPRRWQENVLADVANGKGGVVPNVGDEVQCQLVVNHSVYPRTRHVVEVDYVNGVWKYADETDGIEGLDEELDKELNKEEAMNVDMMGSLGSDAGAVARNRLNVRAAAVRAASVAKAIILWSIFFIFVAIAAGAAWANYNMVTSRATDFRECSARVGDIVLTGRREYSYKYSEILGNRLVHGDSVIENTTVNVVGGGMNIVGLYNSTEPVDKSLTTGTSESYGFTDGSMPGRRASPSKEPEARWWGLSMGKGEQGLQSLKPADTYVFSIGSSVAVVDYKAFCR